MQVEQSEQLNAARVLAAILDEFSAITDYRTLRDSIPRCLSSLISCRCVLLYQCIGETLQFASGSFDDKPGWSAALLSVAHINPIDLNSTTLEAQAWRSRHAVTAPVGSSIPTFVAVPLIYRQRTIGLLVAIRGTDENVGVQFFAPAPSDAKNCTPTFWSKDEVQVIEVASRAIAMLLENTRLLERDRERISELSLLNSISSQMNCSMHEASRLRSIIIQRTREVSNADLSELLLPSTPPDILSWITPALRKMLFQHFDEQREMNPAPLIIERSGDAHAGEYMSELASNIKTFFALPLRSGDGMNRQGTHRPLTSTRKGERSSKLLGVIVGAYHHPWKLRHEEIVLLSVLANQASAVLENISLMEDVVEARNEARKLLRQVLDDQRLKELILVSIPSGLITVDRSGKITTFNHAAEAVLGYDPYEVLGQPVQRILQMPSLHTVLEGGRAQSETLATLDRYGQEVVLEVTLLPLRDDRGKQIGALVTFTDVTTMHRLEEEKRRLDRLASLGEMAASVAHEVRNPLASIKTSMQMLLYELAGNNPVGAGEDEVELRGPLRWMEGRGWEDLQGRTGGAKGRPPGGHRENSPTSLVDDGVQESLLVVLKEVERLDAIVRDLLLFARPRQLHLVECNLVELCERVLHFIQEQCREAGVEVHRIFHEVPPTQMDLAQMEQVLFNLFTNALQAMPDGGILTVSCQVVGAGTGRNAHYDNDTLLELKSPLSVYNEQQKWLELSVSDTGLGIPPDQLERIFQPFFTTKAHGIGLGLPITRRLVEDHHGYILVESQLGYGATISVRLPLDNIQG